MYLLYTHVCECHDYWRPREDDPARVQRSILGLWRYTDCPVWALASFLLDSRACVPPSNERGYDVIECRKAVFWLHRVISYRYFSWERFGLRVVAIIVVAFIIIVVIIIIIISPDVQITLAPVNQQYRYHLASPSALTVVASSNLCGFLAHVSSTCLCLEILSVPRELAFPWATATDFQ